jgi:hypothetical protein
VMTDDRLNYRVIYVGAGRQRTRRLLGFIPVYEPEPEWRQRLASEMEDVSQEMARRGMRLSQVVPILSSVSLQGGWTEGAWLYFESTRERGSSPD